MRNLFGVLFAVLIAVPAFLAQTKEPIDGGPAAKHILVVPDQVKWGAPPKGWLAVRRPSRREARCATRRRPDEAGKAFYDPSGLFRRI